MAITIESDALIAYRNFKQMMRNANNRADTDIAEMAAGSISTDQLLTIYRQLLNLRDKLVYFNGVSGFAQAAKDDEGDQNYDVIAEMTALHTQVGAAMSEIRGSFAKSGIYILGYSFDGTTGTLVPRLFAPAATANLRIELQAISDLIGA